MRKSNRTRKHQTDEFDLLQGGKLPESAVQRQIAAVKRNWLAEIAKSSATRRQAGKYLKKIAPPSRENSKDSQALDGLRRITEGLAKQKLVIPPRKFFPPQVWGNYTLKFTPPYTALGTSIAGQITDVSGQPTISSTGVDALGQLSCSVDSNPDNPSAGTAANMMGVHFKPMFTRATARISFDSSIAFSWYVNSIHNKEAFSRAQGLIQLFQFDNTFVQPSLRRGAFIGWSEVAENSLDFDFISENGPTWSLEAPVSSNHFYFVVISLSCTAIAAGWPGSLAGAKAVVTVPSITVNVTGNPLVEL